MVTLTELRREIRETNSLIEQLLVDKNNDYSTDEDVFSNFEKQAIIAAVLRVDNKRAIGQIISAIILKLVRLCNLIFGGKRPNFESVDDSWKDLIGYSLLGKTKCKEE